MREPSRVTRLLERDRGDAVPVLAASVVYSPKLKVLVAVREYARAVQRGDDGAGGRDAVRPEPIGDFGRVVRALELQRRDPGGRSAGFRQADLETPLPAALPHRIGCDAGHYVGLIQIGRASCRERV